MLRGKIIISNVYIRKEEKTQINNFHLKTLKREKQNEPRQAKKKKQTAEVNKIEKIKPMKPKTVFERLKNR